MKVSPWRNLVHVEVEVAGLSESMLDLIAAVSRCAFRPLTGIAESAYEARCRPGWNRNECLADAAREFSGIPFGDRFVLARPRHIAASADSWL